MRGQICVRIFGPGRFLSSRFPKFHFDTFHPPNNKPTLFWWFRLSPWPIKSECPSWLRLAGQMIGHVDSFGTFAPMSFAGILNSQWEAQRPKLGETQTALRVPPLDDVEGLLYQGTCGPHKLCVCFLLGVPGKPPQEREPYVPPAYAPGGCAIGRLLAEFTRVRQEQLPNSLIPGNPI